MNITEVPDEIVVDRKKLYCFARLYQAYENTWNCFAGCKYCKISNNGENCDKKAKLAEIKTWLTDLTGVNLVAFETIQELMSKEFPIKTQED